jgi:IS4 transposase
LDPNRNLAQSESENAAPAKGQRVLAWTKTWDREEFKPLELHVENEAHVFARRRHVDNLRVPKTRRRYVVAARRAAVSKLGVCLVVASYKENPKVRLLAGETADWWAYHQAPPVANSKRVNKVPQRWQGKLIACTDPTVTARQVIEWLEVRWQIELFFRELKSRLQLRSYVLMKFEAVERYIDLLLMGFLYLEHQRLQDLQRGDPPQERAGEPRVHARTTDRLRRLDVLVNDWNIEQIEQRMQTPSGRRRLLCELRRVPCRVA